MIADDEFAAVFGTAEGNDPDTMMRVARAAGRAKYAVVIVDTSARKAPVCPLATRAAKLADTAAQETARLAGDERWSTRRHDCGVAHASTDGVQVAGWLKRLTKSGTRYNLAVAPGPSRLVCVDADTRAEVDAFLAAARAAGEPVSETPTVRTPGVRNVGTDGEQRWVHKDGGHWWFTLPDGVDYSGAGIHKATADGGWMVMFGPRAYALVPPSVRAEGPYVMPGETAPAPRFLLDLIDAEIAGNAAKRERSAARGVDHDDPINAWAAAVSWSDLLTPDGWTPTGKPDRCGPSCDTWERPGGGASAKSATAHDIGCAEYDRGAGHAPLHLWTTAQVPHLPPGTSTVSKLQYVAHREFNGDVSAAMRALDLHRSLAPQRYEFVDDEWPEGAAPVEGRPRRESNPRHEHLPPLGDGGDHAQPTEPREHANPPGDSAQIGQTWEHQQLGGVEYDQAAIPVPDAARVTPPSVDRVADVPPVVVPAPVAGPRPVLHDDALHGLAGEIVRAYEPSTEADPAALLFGVLAEAGNYFGRHALIHQGGIDHPGRVWVLIAGATASGKKGTAIAVFSGFFRRVDPEYHTTNRASGLSTSEGLIGLVQDPPPRDDADDAEGYDSGIVLDRRRVIVEQEFATLLGRSRREGNTISATLREAYDGGVLRTLVKRDPQVSTEHHITVIGAITPAELVARLSDVDMANGLANRFCLVFSERSKSLPRDVPMPADVVDDLVRRFRRVARFAADVREMTYTEAGAKVWDAYYLHMDARPPAAGRSADLVSRWAANTLRLAVVYALLDESDVLDEQHVRAAIAAWQYVEDSVRHVFNHPDADPDVGVVMEAIDNAGELGLSRQDVFNLFNRHKGKSRIDEIVAVLVATGRYEARKVAALDEQGNPKPGRRSVWYMRKPRGGADMAR